MKAYQQVCTSGFLLNTEGKVLVVKRSDNDDFLPGLWELPGGGTEIGEHPPIGLVREFKEETSLKIEVNKPLYVADYFMEKDTEKIHRVEIFFLCTMSNLDKKVVLSHEHSDYKWLSQDELKNFTMTDYMQQALKVCFENIG